MDIKIVNNKIKFKYRVSAIIINDINQLLVSKYDNDSFCLLGGYVELGESSEIALIRELKEETNLNFSISSYAGITENFFTNNKGQITHEIDIYYYLNPLSKSELKKMDMNYIETAKSCNIKHSFYWLDIDKIDDINLLPNVLKEILKNKSKNFHYIVKDN